LIISILRKKKKKKKTLMLLTLLFKSGKKETYSLDVSEDFMDSQGNDTRFLR
jgi:hypothetical protein